MKFNELIISEIIKFILVLGLFYYLLIYIGLNYILALIVILLTIITMTWFVLSIPKAIDAHYDRCSAFCIKSTGNQ
jgi:hypothetical protein